MLTVMLKPCSGACNMRCKYCFYTDETQKRETANYGRMSEQVQEAVVRKTLAQARGSCTFAFQGGEPTLAGLEFYRRQARLEAQYNIHGVAIHHAIQTNGLVIDDQWGEFLAREHYLVGVSLDGPREIHDAYRPDAQGAGTFSRVMGAIRILQKHQAAFNILTTLTETGARNSGKVYRFFRKQGFSYQQYIPCLDPLGETRGGHDYSLTPEGFARYLKTVFDLWHQDSLKGTIPYHRYFYNLLAILQGQQPEACDLRGICGIQYVVEADGSVYPCDFYMLDSWRLGNLVTDSFEQIDRKRMESGFLQRSRDALESCRGCRWFPLCRGGCCRDREGAEGTPLGQNYFCRAYREFFDYAYPRLERLCRLLAQGKIRPMT